MRYFGLHVKSTLISGVAWLSVVSFCGIDDITLIHISYKKP